MELAEQYKVLQQIVYDLAHAVDGLSTGEIVDKYGLHRRIVPKYMDILTHAGVPIYTDRKRYYLTEGYVSPFTMTPAESDFLYLALERLLMQYGRRSRILQSLMHKLNSKLSNSVIGTRSQNRFYTDEATPISDRWFYVLSEAKKTRHEAWIEYHPLNRPQPSRWLIRPYRFIANPLSDGLYVLCEGSQEGEHYIPLSLKFDRILSAKIADRQFSTVDQNRFLEHFGQTWNVWHSDRPPTRVVLHFEPRHYDRLLESIWHHTQSIVLRNEGYVEFSLAISEPEEMVPWIRSWGSGVVVIEPVELRERILNSLRLQIQAYGLTINSDQQQDALAYLWAKYDRKSHAFHLLTYHLMDVSAVAWVMWDSVLSTRQRQWLSGLLNLSADDTRKVMAFFAGLHDIGKATPDFQKKVPSIYEQLLAVGIPDTRNFDDPHGVCSAVILRTLLAPYSPSKSIARIIGAVIGGHHGSWITLTAMKNSIATYENTPWAELHTRLFNTLKTVLNVPDFQLPDDPDQINIFSVFLSGFISVCDWIGSTDTYFPYVSQLQDNAEYFSQRLNYAQQALGEMGWFAWQSSSVAKPFDAVFPFPPNAFQQAALRALQFDTQPPKLILVEYLTGGGKTELALYIADLLKNLFDLAGVYVAMPTRATSNQMFSRVADYLQHRYPNETINIQLIHSESEQHPLYQSLQPQPQREGNQNALIAQQWFQNRKRALLAPYSVGTIDQAMLGVLQVNHHFVRQYGLSQKIIIFDEIHSYDTYMNAIIDRLLNWMTALQSPMIMLSATLPYGTRQNLISQVGGHSENLPDVPYPRLTVVSHDGQVQVHPLPKPETRTVYLHYINPDSDTLCETLTPVYQQGGCIAVICNTVDEAIQVAYALKSSSGISPDDVLLFHARYPGAWRNHIENQVLSMFGKDGQRPARAILVATQIIEQSLDLDFDLIVSRTAPIDLLIQRMGRLHRHHRVRPAHLAQPHFIIRAPESAENADVPDFGVDAVVYERYLLLKTWLVLSQMDRLVIPDDIDFLMNTVYDTDPAAGALSDDYQQALNTAYGEMDLSNARSQFRGAQHLIHAPHSESLIGVFNERLLDDDHNNIATREFRPGIDIICFGRSADDLLPALPNRPPTKSETEVLTLYRITVQKSDLRKALEALPEFDHWKRIPHLRYARPVVFENGYFDVPNSQYRLRLTPAYGLEIIKEER